MTISDAFPLDPPTDWFTELPAWFEPNMKLTIVTDGPEAGRVAATVAQRGTYLLGGGTPWTSTDSPTGYRDAMQCDTVCADGSIVRTAALALNVNHVPVDPTWTYGRAVDAMANTGAQIARVQYHDIPGYGTVALGAAWPGVDDLQLRKAQTCPLSGDWRWREEYGAYDMAGAIFVNNPGMPLPNRPVFMPLAMAASLALDHPPIIGSWRLKEAPVNCATCGQPLAVMPQPNGTTSVLPCAACAARVAAAAPTPPGQTPQDSAPAPDAVHDNNTPSLDERVASLEERMAALEDWAVQDAMTDMDGMAVSAALPEPAVTAAYSIVPQGNQFCVESADGKSMGCHPTSDEAQAQIDALMASEAQPAAT